MINPKMFKDKKQISEKNDKHKNSAYNNSPVISPVFFSLTKEMLFVSIKSIDDLE